MKHNTNTKAPFFSDAEIFYGVVLNKILRKFLQLNVKFS